MIVDPNAISLSILHQTLLEELSSLQLKYSTSNLVKMTRKYNSARSTFNLLQQQQKQMKQTLLDTTQQRREVLQGLLQQEAGRNSELGHYSKINKELFNQLHKTRCLLRSHQHQIAQQQHSKQELSSQMKRVEQKIEQYKLRAQDHHQDLTQLHHQELGLRYEIALRNQQIDELTSTAKSQKQHKGFIRTSNNSLDQEIKELRSTLSKKKQIFNSQALTTQNLIRHQHQQARTISNQINIQNKTISELQQSLAKTILDHSHTTTHIQQMEAKQTALEQRLQQTLKLSQDLSSKIFQDKVEITNQKGSNMQLKQHIILVRKYKDCLLALTAQF